MTKPSNLHPTSTPADERRLSEAFAGAAAETHFYRAILDSSGLLATVVDPRGAITFQSRAAATVFDHLPNNGVGMQVTSLVHPEDARSVDEALAAAAHGSSSQTPVEMRVRHPRGGWRWLEGRIDDHLADPVIAGLLIVSRDVTELRHERQRYRQAERCARLGVWRLEFEGAQYSHSIGFTEFLGYSMAEFGPDPYFIYRVLHEDDRERVRETIRRLYLERRGDRYTARARAKNGEWRVVSTEAFVETDADARPIALIGVCQDVTERAQMLEALKRNEEQYRLIAEECSDIITRMAPDGSVTFMSPAIERVLGHATAKLIGYGVREYLHKEDMAAVASLVAPRAFGSSEATAVYRMRHSEGHFVWMETTARAICDPQTGQVSEYIAVSRDISERKTFELDLMAARERAEAASRTKSRFLANMSHELRTPLNAILGFSEMMQGEMFGPIGHPKYREYGDLINESGRLLLELINDLLDMAKIEAGRYDLYREPLALREIFEACARLVEYRAQAAGLSIVIESETHMPAVMADRRAVKQIVLNLLSNAVKFTPAGGTITLREERTVDDIVLTVRDTGVGIPEEALPRLAQPFEQVTDDHTLSHAGTGLGLALVKALTRLHGGRLEIASQLGEGTQVRVHLPIGHTPAIQGAAGAI
ncbi:MAG: PAS domain S-box protein [Alphaproteobacteria bacterium]|nr:PAS domain S-box protein [Alphaproteobacteria bacterium]